MSSLLRFISGICEQEHTQLAFEHLELAHLPFRKVHQRYTGMLGLHRSNREGGLYRRYKTEQRGCTTIACLHSHRESHPVDP